MSLLTDNELTERLITPGTLQSIDPYEGGLLLLDKPLEWSSFQAVKKVRFLLREEKRKLKVGHAGTLDPLATGLLILCTGKFTKQLQQLQGREKTYRARIKLGATTASYDCEQPQENQQSTDHLSKQQIQAALAQFRGEIEQLPPMFSALKVDGQRAYKAARKGREVALKLRPVVIQQLELTDYQSPEDFELLIRCSKGTYIRSLARDLGEALGVGGYLSGLVRTQIGPFSLENAWQIPNLEAQIRSHQSNT